MKRAILFLVAALAVTAQDTTRIFELKYAEPNDVKNLLGAFPVATSVVGSLHMISVRGNKEAVEMVAEALKKIDVAPEPKKNIEFTGYVVLASSKEAVAAEPPELAPVFKQLRGVFAYKSYRVAETFFIRGRDGQASAADGMLQLDPPRPYTFTFRPASILPDHTIRVDRMIFRLTTGTVHNIETAIDIREGQKVVVGKANMTGGDEAVVLVLTAKIVE